MKKNILKKEWKKYKKNYKILNSIQLAFFLVIIFMLSMSVIYLNSEAKKVMGNEEYTQEELQQIIMNDVENPVSGGMTDKIQSFTNKVVTIIISLIILLAFTKSVKDTFTYKYSTKIKKFDWKYCIRVFSTSLLIGLILLYLTSYWMYYMMQYSLAILLFCMLLHSYVQTIIPLYFAKKKSKKKIISYDDFKSFSLIHLTSLLLLFVSSFVILIMYGLLIQTGVVIVSRIIFMVLFWGVYLFLRSFTSNIYYDAIKGV